MQSYPLTGHESLWGNGGITPIILSVGLEEGEQSALRFGRFIRGLSASVITE
jgi:hypothetical protein